MILEALAEIFFDYGSACWGAFSKLSKAEGGYVLCRQCFFELNVQFKKTLPTNYIAQQWGSRWPAPSETAPMGADGAAGER